MPPKRTPAEQAAIRRFGDELARLREMADLSQADLAKLLNVSKQQVGAVERGERRPTKQLAHDADTALDAHGRLQDLWPGAKRSRPWWFEEYVHVEDQSQVISEFQPQTVPGLLQTRDYASCVLGATQPPRPAQEQQAQLAERLERQRIITRENPAPPLLHFVVEEGALRRAVGSAEVMRAQYEHLLTQAALPHVQLHIMPYDRGAHGALNGAFIVLRVSLTESLVYAEVPDGGQIITDLQVVSDCIERFGVVRGMALSPQESMDFIESLLKG